MLKRLARYACVLIAIGFLAKLTPPAFGQIEPPGDSTLSDHLAVVSRAPGVPEGSIFAGFENNENVSLFNGNLLVSHPSSPVFTKDGGGSFGLNRVYNSKTVIGEKMRVYGCQGETDAFSFGINSWVGRGWKMHLGRIFRKSLFSAPDPATCTDGDTTPANYSFRESYFEDSSGTQYRFAPYETNAHPRLRYEFHRASANDDCPEPWYSDGNNCAVANQGDSAHYTVTYPDGTRLWLEELVAESTYTSTGYIINHDVAGWYTTGITDSNGNEVVVTYHDNSASIATVSYTHADETVATISTELYESGDFTGKLHKVEAAGYGLGDDSIVYTFNYTLSSEGGANLTSVDLPADAGSISYGYVDHDLTAAGVIEDVLSRITYPTGGVSSYVYDGYIAGQYQECPKMCWISPHCPQFLSDCRNDPRSYRH